MNAETKGTSYGNIGCHGELVTCSGLFTNVRHKPAAAIFINIHAAELIRRRPVKISLNIEKLYLV